MKRCLSAAALALLIAAAVGCGPSSQYDWGSYQASVWMLYAPPSGNSADVGKQIDALAKEIHRTEARAKPGQPSRVPPGKYAHLGYLYAMQGDPAAARQCMEAEKKTYPESAKFVDVLIARMP